MKCGACGYEYRRETRWVDKVTRYKQGKKKGEIKSIDQEDITFEVGDREFVKLTFEKEVDELGHYEYRDYHDFTPVNLYVCPECGTVKVLSCSI